LVHGRWIDATDSLTEVQEQVVALLSASPVPHPDRWAIDETRGFHGYQVLPDTPLDVVTTIATNIRRHGPAYAVWLDAIS
jgi:antirestriction protein